MEDEAKRGGAEGAGHRQGRPLERGVAFRPGPDGRHRQEVGQVEAGDHGPPHVGIGFARDRPQPGLDGVEVLDPRHQALGVERRLDRPRPRLRPVGGFAKDADGQAEIAVGAGVGAEGGQGGVALPGLADRIRVEEGRLFLGDGLAQQHPQSLALGEPTLAHPHDLQFRTGLVEGDPPRRPAIGKRQGPETVEQAGTGGRRQSAHRDHLQPPGPQSRLRPPGQGGIGQQDIEEHRRVRRPHGHG